MAITMEQANLFIRNEYERLCEVLGLTPVVLNIVYIGDPSQSSPLNTMARYIHPQIVLPFLPGDLAKPEPIQPEFPPLSWNNMERTHWPQWRTELWHEVCHQVQDQILHHLRISNSQEGNTLGWERARIYVAERFNVNLKDIDAVI